MPPDYYGSPVNQFEVFPNIESSVQTDDLLNLAASLSQDVPDQTYLTEQQLQQLHHLQQLQQLQQGQYAPLQQSGQQIAGQRYGGSDPEYRTSQYQVPSSNAVFDGTVTPQLLQALLQTYQTPVQQVETNENALTAKLLQVCASIWDGPIFCDLLLLLMPSSYLKIEFTFLRFLYEMKYRSCYNYSFIADFLPVPLKSVLQELTGTLQQQNNNPRVQRKNFRQKQQRFVTLIFCLSSVNQSSLAFS